MRLDESQPKVCSASSCADREDAIAICRRADALGNRSSCISNGCLAKYSIRLFTSRLVAKGSELPLPDLKLQMHSIFALPSFLFVTFAELTTEVTSVSFDSVARYSTEECIDQDLCKGSVLKYSHVRIKMRSLVLGVHLD